MNIETGNLIFMDIETVSGKKKFEELTEDWQALWEKKALRALPEDTPVEDYYSEKAALYAEFGKVVCISFGYYQIREHKKILRLKSLYGEDEKELLSGFCDILSQFEKKHKNWVFAGHNIREFDLPYLSRRLLINGLSIPASMNFYNLKPWEFNVIDTMHIWRFGDMRYYTSLELLSAALGVPSPKTDIHGSQVGNVFWGEKDFNRIAEYCQRDVTAVANIIRRLNGKPILANGQVEIA